MSIKTQFSSLISKLLPTQTRVIVRGHQQPPALSHTVDVDTLHGYLRLAEGGDCTMLFGLYRDILASHAHTQSCFSTRKLAVLGDGLTLTPTTKNPADVELTKQVQAHLLDRPGWMQILSHFLDSTLYPISIAQRAYRASNKPGWRYELGEITAIPHVHLAWPQGELSIKDTSDAGYFLGTFSQPQTRTHILHTGSLIPSVPDWWGGSMRALIFWWLFATMNRDWWARFLDRFGSPFIEGKYDEADENSKYELANAFSAATRLFGLVVSKETEIKLHQANTQGSDAFERFQTFANAEISKLILGQTSSSDTKSLGIGGGAQAAAQSEVRDDIRKFDSLCLSHTIRTQILSPLWQLNGWITPLPSVAFGLATQDEADLTGDLVSQLFSAGIELTDEGIQTLSNRHGLQLRRVSTITPISLSARAKLPLIPSVARRAARQQQARRAVDGLVTQSAPKLARLMRNRAAEFATQIADSSSLEEASANIATLAASYDSGIAADLISSILTSASANAVLRID